MSQELLFKDHPDNVRFAHVLPGRDLVTQDKVYQPQLAELRFVSQYLIIFAGVLEIDGVVDDITSEYHGEKILTAVGYWRISSVLITPNVRALVDLKQRGEPMPLMTWMHWNISRHPLELHHPTIEEEQKLHEFASRLVWEML